MFFDVSGFFFQDVLEFSDGGFIGQAFVSFLLNLVSQELQFSLIFGFSSGQFVEEVYFFIESSLKVLGSFFVNHTFSSLLFELFGKHSDFLLGLFAASFDDLLHFLDFLFISQGLSSFLIDFLLQEEELFFIKVALSGEFFDNSSKLSFLFSDFVLHSSDVVFIFLFFLFVIFEESFEFLSFSGKGLEFSHGLLFADHGLSSFLLSFFVDFSEHDFILLSSFSFALDSLLKFSFLVFHTSDFSVHAFLIGQGFSSFIFNFRK